MDKKREREIEIEWKDTTLNGNSFEEEIEEDENEDETNQESTEFEKPFDAEKIRVDAKPFSVRQMCDMITEKQLNLQPGFQRRKVWKERKRKSLLIESLMLRIPLPVFYVYEDEDSIWHVVDGLQRMSTINEFVRGEFRLSGLQYLKHSNGCYFSELEQKYKTRITTTTLTANVIDSRTPTQVKYDIFRRINTGGVPLNAQEIRNSTGKPRVRKLISELASTSEFIEATDGKINDLRMDAQELVLRFIAFYEAYDPTTNEVKYKKSMENFLDEAYVRLNQYPEDKLKQYKKAFLCAMQNAKQMFGKYAFRRFGLKDIHSPKMKQHNKSLFTCMSVLLSYYCTHKIARMDLQEKALVALATMIENDTEFNESLTKGTGDPSRINIQFKKMANLLRCMLNDKNIQN